MRPRRAARQLVVSTVATVFTLFLIYTAGGKFLLLSCVIYAPGTILYVMARRETGRRIVPAVRAGPVVVLVAGAVAGIVSLATGAITI